MTTPPEIHSVRAESSRSTGNPPSRRTSDTIRRMALFTGLLFSGMFAGFLVAVLILEAQPATIPGLRLHPGPAGRAGAPRRPRHCPAAGGAARHRDPCRRHDRTAGAHPLAGPDRTRPALRNVHDQHAGQRSHQHGPTRLVCPRTAQRLGPRARPLADRSSRAHHHRRVRVHHPCGSENSPLQRNWRGTRRSLSSLCHLRTKLRRAFIAPVIAQNV